MYLGVFAVVAPALCTDADDGVEGETALVTELWLADCAPAQWLFNMVGEGVLEGHRLAVSLDTGV